MNKFNTWITELLSDKGYKYRGLRVLNALYARHVISHADYVQAKKQFLEGQRQIKGFIVPVVGPGFFQAKPSALSAKGEAAGRAGAGQPIVEDFEDYGR